MKQLKRLYLSYQCRKLEKTVAEGLTLLRTCNKYEAIPITEEIAYLNKILAEKKARLLRL